MRVFTAKAGSWSRAFHQQGFVNTRPIVLRILRCASTMLALGQSLPLDASFNSNSGRSTVFCRMVAEKPYTLFLHFRCECDSGVLLAGSDRLRGGPDRRPRREVIVSRAAAHLLQPSP
jgi:hypothetical protein